MGSVQVSTVARRVVPSGKPTQTKVSTMKTEQAAAEKMASSPASDAMQHLDDAWSRGDKLTAIGVIVAVLGIMAAIFSAEIKRMLQHVWSKIKPNS